MSDQTIDHYPLSPSGASRWLICPGSIQLSQGPPDEPSVYAIEGTNAHELAANALRQWLVDRVRPTVFDDAVNEYLSYVAETVEQYQLNFRVVSMEIEKQVVSPTLPSYGGTCDFYVVLEHLESGTRIGHLVDYKHGAGVLVDAEDNPQLLSYCDLLSEHHPDVSQWTATIVQPRARFSSDGDFIRSASFDAADLAKHRKRVIAAWELAQSDSPPLDATTAPEHCRWCNACAVCPELYRVVRQDVLAELRCDPSADSEDVDVQRARWARMFALQPAIDAMLSQMGGRILDAMRVGVTFPGLKAVEVAGRRRWALPDEEVLSKLAGMKIGKKLATEPKLKSPAKLVAMLDPDTQKKVEKLIVRPESTHTVAAASDRRKAVNFVDPLSLLTPIDESAEPVEDLFS